MKVIIAEKPSVAKDIANALGKPVVKDGYYESGGYIITYAYGHLITIDSSIAPKKWEFDTLPIFPNFKYMVMPDKTKQFKIIKNLASKASEVIIATDAGREGELIARLILLLSGYKGRILRFWTSEALTPDVVRREMSKLKNGKDFDSLYQSALARQHSDWLVGINLSRAVSIKAGFSKKPWSVGRVQTPVLRLIVDREIERNNFKPEEYFIIKATFAKGKEIYEGYLFDSSKYKINQQSIDKTNIDDEDNKKEEKEIGSKLDKKTVEQILQVLDNEKTGIIKDIQKENKKDLPPLLHSLTTLQKEANTLYNLTAQKTLDIVQKLYEEYKVCSYPRTEAQHLGDDAVGLAVSVLKKLGKDDLIKRVNIVGKRVFDSKKLTDHHAIIPLNKLPDNASDLERKVYNLIWRRFIGVFMPPYEYQVTNVITDVKGLLFKTAGNVDITLGWKELYKNEQQKNNTEQQPILSISHLNLNKGESVKKTKHEAIQKFTQPPPLYTEASILAKMKKLNLGTPATRAGCIENLKNREYIAINKKFLLPTPKGIELIKHLRNNKVSDPEMTAQWETELENIYVQKKGKQGYDKFMGNIRNFVTESIDEIKNISISRDSVVSAKAIRYAELLSAKTGIPIPPEAKKDKNILSKYIENTKKQIPQNHETQNLAVKR